MADSETLTVLKSIDLSLKEILSISRSKRPAPGQAAAPKSNGGEVASDRDLDSQYGDPVVKFEPRDWSGPPMKGRKFSETDAEFLDLLAEVFDYFAAKAEETNELYNGKPVAPYKRKDAARARGWAARMRSGKHTPPKQDAPDEWS